MDLMPEGKHSLEGTDHQIVPHSTDFAQNYPKTILDVYSLDTGVLVLLTAFHAEIPAAKTLPCFALKSHINAFLASDDDILRAFAAIGNDPHVSNGIFRQTGRYICLLYKPTNSKFESLLIAFRWALFSKFGKEGKQLPPTTGTLVPHTRRASHLALVLKCQQCLVSKFLWQQLSPGLKNRDIYIQSSALFHLPLKLKINRSKSNMV